MGIRERNRKVAVARWSKIHEHERENIRNDGVAVLYKAALCGFLAGDGSVFCTRQNKADKKWAVCFYPDDPIMLQTYLDMISYVYGKTCYLTPEKNFFRAQLTSKVVAQDLLSISDYSAKEWEVPSFVYEDRWAQRFWLRAFYSAEGYVTDEVVRVQTINDTGMKQVSELLTYHNIHHSSYAYVPPQENYSTVHIIIIRRIEDRRRFRELIGFWHKQKSMALWKALHSKTNS